MRLAEAHSFKLITGRPVGIQPPQTVKISNFGHKFAPQGSLVCTVVTKFSDFIRVHSFKFLIWSLSGDKQPSYKHFSHGWGIFP